MQHLQGDRSQLYTAQTSGASLAIMLEHLLDFDPPAASINAVTLVDKAPAADIAAAQLSTSEWLEKMGAAPSADSVDAQAATLAQEAFQTLAAGVDPEEQKKSLLALKTPPAVRHLTGMLTAYDWAFIEQAAQLRGYAVAQILEETKNPDSRIRLRALELLGRVTEVALFTDRMEIKKTEMPDHELDARIKEKLNRFMGVVDTEVSEITEIKPKNASSNEAS